MRKAGKFSASLLAACLLFVSLAEGRQAAPAVDRVFRISGSVSPGSPSGLAGGYETFVFGIYEAEQSGTPLWQEVQTLAVDRAGPLHGAAGRDAAEGLPVDLFSSGAPRWLGTEAQGGGQSPAPRTLLTSVPYTLRAATAGDARTLAGRPVF